MSDGLTIIVRLFSKKFRQVLFAIYQDLFDITQTVKKNTKNTVK